MNLAQWKWLEIVRFEVVFQLRRKSTWLFVGLYLLPLIGVTADGLRDAATSDVLFNAPLRVAENGVMFGIVAMLWMAAIAGDAATRDIQTRMEPLVHPLPVSRVAYVGGRFAGAFAVSAMLLLVVPLVQLVAGLVHPGVDAAAVGPVRPAAYLQGYVLFIVPNAFVVTALMFALATVLRHTVGSYVAAAMLFASLQATIDIIAERLGKWGLASLLDPSGFIALELAGRTWAPGDLDTRYAGGDGALLLNRLLWLVLAGAIVWLLTRLRAGAGLQWRRRRPTDVALMEHRAPVVVPDVPRDFGVLGRARQTLAVARDALREVALVAAIVVVPFLALNVTGYQQTISRLGAGTMVLPTTDRILAPIEDDAPPPVVLLIIMFPVLVAGEMIWRQRDAGVEGLTDSLPVPDGVQLAGKLLGLWTVLLAIKGLIVLAGVIAQAWMGWYDFDFGLYARILGLGVLDPLVFGLFALSLHVIANHKHVGHVLVLALLIASANLSEVMEHPLLRLGSEPEWRYSAISGFGPYTVPVLAFDLYWAFLALVLALVARLFWVRGVERGMRERLRLARSRFTPRAAAGLAGALALVLGTGGFIFYNTNVLNAYAPRAEGERRQAEYERQYARYRGTPQPSLSATVMSMELYPDRREAEVGGMHRLVNATTAPIDTVHVAIASAVHTDTVEFDRPARVAVNDDALGHRIYVLDQPLAPGDSLAMRWRVRYAPRGFPAGEIPTAVVGNGSFIIMRDWMPVVGYQPRRELSEAGARREHGLAARPLIPSLDDVPARNDATGSGVALVDITVGTAAGQTAVAPGRLRSNWTEGGRSYFRYVTAAPVGQDYAIFSAKYAVRRARAGDVDIEVYHNPRYDGNVASMMRGMEASLAQFSRRFGPYRHDFLRFVEYPSQGGSLHAADGTIWFQEMFSIMDPAHEPRRIDLPFAVTGHEVAHQFQPLPARVEGAFLIAESFAWYAALGMVEQELGAAHLGRLLDFMRESYLRPRRRADVPLLRASDSFLGYRKGPFAMYALQEYVGRDQVDLAWRRVREQHASGQPPFATTRDLYRELQAVTPDSLRQLLGDLLERNTFWELRTRSASAQPGTHGTWQLTLEVVARKVVVDTAGTETEVPMHDLIEIGAYAGTWHRVMHRIRSGAQTITMTVPARPARAGIDPRHLLIDVLPDDNVVNVTGPTP